MDKLALDEISFLGHKFERAGRFPGRVTHALKSTEGWDKKTRIKGQDAYLRRKVLSFAPVSIFLK